MADRSIGAFAPKNTPRLRIPILAKITVPYLLLSLIFAIVAAFIITQLITENIADRFNKQLFEAGKISSELIVGYETRLLGILRLLENVEGVAPAIEANDPNALRSLAMGIVANDQQEAVEFLDARGNHLLSIHHLSGDNPEDYTVSTGGQTLFSGLAMVQRILDRSSDERGDKFSDFVATDFGNYLYVAGPVYTAQNDLAGVILVGRSLPTLAADMHTKTFAQISFYNPSGRLIESTLPFSHNLTPDLAAQTLSIQESSSARRDLSSQRDLGVANIPFAEILGAWVVRGDHQIGILGIALSQNSFVETSLDSRWRIFILSASAIFLIILVGIRLANAITRPLLHLVTAAKKVADGDLEIIVNPQSNDEVSALTESFNTMVMSLNQSQKQIIQSYDETLAGWANALELRDKETVGHSQRVTKLTVQLALSMGIQGETLINIRRGALLHDIGKMGTSDAILQKNGPLDETERRIIQQHPMDGFNLLRQINFLEPALEIPLCHHERWDGTGYPRGLKGDEIPISARIFAVVDVFDAMTQERRYRKAIPVDEVIQYLKEAKGSQFDPMIVDAFIELLDKGFQNQNDRN